jgi:phosphoenolpyruvate-protein kinase (PTS system EI component)
MSAAGTIAGGGERVSGSGEFGGRIARAETISDVLGLAGEDLSETILLTEQASASAFAPILPRVAGVICLRGGPSAHLAIISRGLDLPCVMAVQLQVDLSPGDEVVVDGEGKVWLR